MDNSVGRIVEMPRDKVNANQHEVCGSGLHVCSRSYLSEFSGEHTMVCKINPRDVVSVPVDYNNAKMRVCRYEVIEELKKSSDLIKDNAVKIHEGVKVSDDTALLKSAKAKNPKRELSREEKWDDYIKTRGIPEDLTSLHGKPRKAFIKFCARLHTGGRSEKAGPDICSAKTLVETRIVIFGF
jgi:hypothetical protein